MILLDAVEDCDNFKEGKYNHRERHRIQEKKNEIQY